MFPVGRSGERTRPCHELYVGFLSSIEECAGLWLIVALAGVNSGNTPQLLNFFFLCFLFVEAVPRGYIKLCNDPFILSVWSDVKL